MTLTPQCWFCSSEIRSTDRARVVADLNVLVHVGRFDKLYETEGPKSWSNDRRAAERSDPQNDDDEEANAS